MPETLHYRPPGPVARRFMLDPHPVRLIQGPFGSGKSSSCCMKLLELMQGVPHSLPQGNELPGEGKRRPRILVSRNTYPMLTTTTIPTWKKWFPEDQYGQIKMQAPFHQIFRYGDVEAEVWFLALDRPEDIDKLYSFEFTFAWFNEAREASKTNIDGIIGRLGRAPSYDTIDWPRLEASFFAKHGRPFNKGTKAAGFQDADLAYETFLLMDTNAPPPDHWVAIMSGQEQPPEWMDEEEKARLVRPDDWSFFIQPPALVEHLDKGGKIQAYTVNPNAENLQNLLPSYYPKGISGKTKAMIDVFYMNRCGQPEAGKVVFPEFNSEYHVVEVEPDFTQPWVLGVDPGLNPACVWAQKWGLHWILFDELVLDNASTREFALRINAKHEEWMRKMEQWRQETNGPPQPPRRVWGDPDGDNRSPNDDQKRRTYQIMNAHGVHVVKAMATNDIVTRLDCTHLLLQQWTGGYPRLRVHKRCRKLIAGFNTGYRYMRRTMTKTDLDGEQYQDKPIKNSYSHPQDGWQHLTIGEGIHRELTTGDPHAARRGNVGNVRNPNYRPGERTIAQRPRRLRDR